MIKEQLLTRPEFITEAEAVSRNTHAIVTPDASIAQLSLAIRMLERPTSELIARMGLSKLLRGETVAIEALDANYIRRSDAEIFFKSGR